MSLIANPQLLDVLIAPGYTTFTRAVIPDLAGKFPEAEHWLGNFYLNSIIGGCYPPKFRQLVHGFLRRAQLAVAAYAEARVLTLKFLDCNHLGNPRFPLYYAATARWENFAIESSIAMDTLRWMDEGRRLFVKGDRSLEDRLYHLANKVKHIGDDITNKDLYDVTDSIALWLSEAGLNGVGVQVTYTEAAQFLERITKVADEIQNPSGYTEARSK